MNRRLKTKVPIANTPIQPGLCDSSMVKQRVETNRVLESTEHYNKSAKT